MSKSLNNHIGINDEPNDMFGKIMSIPDTLITRYFSLITNTPPEEIDDMDSKMTAGENPRDFKIALGIKIVSTLHSEEAALSAKDHFAAIFAKGQVPDEMPEITVLAEETSLSELLVTNAISPSKKEVKRLITQGAISINQEKIGTDPNFRFTPQDGDIIKVGKRTFVRLVIS